MTATLPASLDCSFFSRVFVAGSETGSYTSRTRSPPGSRSGKGSDDEEMDNDNAQPITDRAGSTAVSSQSRQRSAPPQASTSNEVSRSQLQVNDSNDDKASDDKPVEATTLEGSGGGDQAENAKQHTTDQELPKALSEQATTEETTAKGTVTGEPPVEAEIARVDGQSHD